MPGRLYLILVGGAAAVIGLVLFLVPVSVTTTVGNTVQCGTVAEPSVVDQNTVSVLQNDLTPDEQQLLRGIVASPMAGTKDCADSLGTRKVWSIGLIGVGVVVFGASFIRRRPQMSSPAAPPAPTS